MAGRSLAFPTSLGAARKTRTWGSSLLSDKIDGGEVQVCCVDAIDGECWYNDDAHPGLEGVPLHAVRPLLDRRGRSDDPGEAGRTI
jgi:esterase/lipase superfamily enzyme